MKSPAGKGLKGMLLLLTAGVCVPAPAQETPRPTPAPVVRPRTAPDGNNALIAAIRDNDPVRLAAVLERGGNVNATDANLSTPLMQAAAAAGPEVVRLLVEKGAEVRARDKTGFTPLIIAAYSGKPEVVRYLLERGADPNDADNDRRTALMGAAYSGREDVALRLLESGAEINATDKDGFTPLMVASGTRNAALVRLLLDRGANINAPTRSGFTPLMQAAGAGQPAVVAVLLERGAEVNARSQKRATALLVAAYAGNAEIARLLLERGATVEVADSVGHTPLIGAAYSGNVAIARSLLDRGASIKSKTTAGLDALMQAAYSGRRDVAALLLARGAAVDSRTVRGLTPLMQAVGAGNATTARLLLDYGADVNAEDSSRQTPAVWARKRGHEEMLPLLRQAGAVIDGKTASAPVPVPSTTAPFCQKQLALSPPSVIPEIHGPHVLGMSPGRPFVYRIPATGKGKLLFSATGLPAGVLLDKTTGILRGKIAAPGRYPTVLKAGKDGKPFALTLICAKGKIGQTPPLGWSAWNLFGDTVDFEKVREQADWLIRSGLAAHGFNYILLDDAWQGRRDLRTGELTANQRMRSIKALADYLHARGLRLGIYSSPNEETGGGYTGSQGREEQDARTFAAWGVDYLKYDWTDNKQGRLNVDRETVIAAFARMRTALDKTDRDIFYAITPYGFGGVQPWGDPPVSANSWWTSLQVVESWDAMSRNGFRLGVGFGQPAGPGHWNDPGWLLVGKIGSASINPHFTALTADEQKTQISLWTVVAAPLILSCDLRQLDPNRFFPITTALLTNDEVLAVHQDALGKPGERIGTQGRAEIWARSLADGTIAIGLFNRGDSEQKVTVDFESLKEWDGGERTGPQPVRDLWLRQDKGTATDSFSASVPAHGVVLIRLGKPTTP
ncbi:MAG: ankyrin repeat domain-containing protein [Capsulimonadales bacterium]|nr:ankyrin repeat domain-containing protein [Capsulimonadales bacterium]